VKIQSWIKAALLIAASLIALNAHAEWQCFAGDSGGHLWSSGGLTQEHANEVALSFCSAYSPDSGSCHITNCATK